MPVLTISNKEDFQALLLGLAFYATGGGGEVKEGWEIINECFLSKAKSLVLHGLDEVDGFIVSAYMVGSMAPGLKPRKPVVVENPVAEAMKLLREKAGVSPGGVVAVELGAGNTPVAFRAAALAGLPIVDGDRVGRAAPELHQDTMNIFEWKMTPSSIVTPTGDSLVLYDYADVDDYEAIARHMAVLSGSYAAVIDAPLDPERAEKAIIKGTVSKAYEVGAKVLEARKNGGNPVDALVEACEGWLVFEGVVEEYKWKNESGFLLGEAVIRGEGDFKGRKLRTWIKNEHIMVWLDDQPIVMPPDILSLVDENAEPVLNNRLREGMHVYAVAAKAPEVWRTPKGLELFGPKHFGFDYDYVPVEELVRKVL